MEDNHGLSWPIGGPASPDPSVMGFDSMNMQGGNQGGKPHKGPWTDEKGYVHPADKVAPVVKTSSAPKTTVTDDSAEPTPAKVDPMDGKYSDPVKLSPEAQKARDRQDSVRNANPDLFKEKNVKVSPLSPMAPDSK